MIEPRPMTESEEDALLEEFLLQCAQNVTDHFMSMEGIAMFRDLPPEQKLGVMAQGAMLGIVALLVNNFKVAAPGPVAEARVREYIHSIVDPALRNAESVEKNGILREVFVTGTRQ